MQETLRPIKFVWYLKTLPVFFIGFVFLTFLAVTSNKQNFVFSVLFFLLITATILAKQKFTLLFDKDYLKVKQFLKKGIDIPYEKIRAIYIRQSPVDKMLEIKSMIIQFDSPSEQSKTELRAFGGSIKTILHLEIPGTYGNLLTIPGITPQLAEELKDKILNFTRQNPPEVSNMGIGYPYYNQLFRFGYIIGMILLLIVAFLFIATLIFSS